MKPDRKESKLAVATSSGRRFRFLIDESRSPIRGEVFGRRSKASSGFLFGLHDRAKLIDDEFEAEKARIAEASAKSGPPINVESTERSDP